MKKSLRVTVFILVAMVIFLSGCLNPRKSKPTRYFVLNSLYSAENRPEPVADLKNAVIVIGPVRIPMKLDRPQIVTRTTQNEIRMAPLAEWAEPLDVNLSRVLAENLSILLGSDKIAVFPWLKSVKTDYQLTVDVTRFSGNLGKKASLRAQWTVFGENGKTELLKSYANIEEPVRGEDVAAVVKAQNRTVERLSRQIAEAIKARGNQSNFRKKIIIFPDKG
ncbi:MAG: membrane integrity-associated transporter subunit PqiC [Deltaproteobacteria bacterium]|nr:membrane integrity-associated transporter subunit PqiC [Deltaproteobacteria bacterium]